MDGIYYPKWATQALDVTSSPVRRLGSYIFRGARVEAFGMFLSGAAFTENGSSAQSVFWRSMSSTYPTMCVINNTTLRDFIFSGTAGGTITPKNYIGRVMACVGTPTLSSGTADARAALGAVQDDQMQGHWHLITDNSGVSFGDYSFNGGSTMSSARTGTGTAKASTQVTDGTNGTPRKGKNTRENTYSVPVPMVVSLLPYGQITL